MIYRATLADIDAITDMAMILFHGHDRLELKVEFLDFLEDDGCALFIAKEGDKYVGFAQVQLRHDYVEGTESSPVGYLEGIYVDEAYRNRGFASELLKSCESWAREKHCTEFASDCELTNDTSLAFHLSVGFEEANRIICFTKKL